VSGLSISIENEACFTPKTEGMTETALILGQLYRHNGSWKFKANGAGFNSGLAALAGSFGVDIADDEGEEQAGVSLEKQLQEKAPRLVNLAKPVRVSLEKNNLTGTRARVAFVLDCSGSMSLQFSSGNVQSVLDRIAVLAVQFDDDMALDLWAFSERFKKAEDVSLDNIDGYIDRLTTEGKRGFFGGMTLNIVKGLGIVITSRQ